MSKSIEPTLTALQQLIEVVAQLRSPDGGCPWDLAQTPQSLTPYVLEEAYEVVDAINQGEPEAIADELGDLLLQVVLQAQIASETGQFDLATVVEGITAKLIRRHPHVFGDVMANSVEAVKENWEQIKSTENPEQTFLSKLRRYARSLPPLTASMKISQKAVSIGFEWENAAQVWEKFEEELGELKQAIAHESAENQQAELGDVLFTLVNIARWYRLDPDAALAGTNQRFIDRLTQMEAQADRPLEDYAIEELEQLWQQAKLQLRQNK
ncbi:nucleoside triphosphate pyrophosphohydrolase [Microcoleus sp. FACHB-1515]|uniref:nucleoside triphosphate pyrophosphohydrolase n=1 Tax=Cyanophyceae TaxID=3028117 RepID=UPI001681D95A|nr:nucleoside triphosphate pyrophosphohydrolase [Microcoleus sp. FACHB-1515]MBD2091255.1 nucleoside triphosphate pyrophosphohydrolase [Microcoleus sp. FACHB-1515]